MPGVAVGLGKIKEMDSGRPEKLADEVGGGGIAHQENGVQLVSEQGADRVLGVLVGELGRAAGFDAVELEEGQGEGACSAARRANGQTFAFQFRKDGVIGSPPIKNKERFIGDAAEGNQRAVAGGIGHSALDEANVHLKGGVFEALEVLRRAFGGKGDQLNAVGGEIGAVSLGEFLEGTAGGSGGDGDGFGRGGEEEPKDGQGDGGADGKNGGQGRAAAEAEHVRRGREQRVRSFFAAVLRGGFRRWRGFVVHVVYYNALELNPNQRYLKFQI